MGRRSSEFTTRNWDMEFLTLKQRRVVELRASGLDTREIARLLHRSQGGVKEMILRAQRIQRDWVGVKD